MDCPDGYRVMREDRVEGPRFYIQQRKQRRFLWWTWEVWKTRGEVWKTRGDRFSEHGLYFNPYTYGRAGEALDIIKKEVEAARLKSKPWTVVAE